MARRARRLARLAVGTAATAAAVWAIKDIPYQMGASPLTGERGARVRRSPQWREGKFRNSVPGSTLPTGGSGLLREALRRQPDRHPSRPVPVVTTAGAPAADGLHITWYGHASA